jgi:hypothetical protein
MYNFFNRVEALWNGLKAGQAKTRAHFMISRDHIENGAQLGSPFEARQQYFQIVINEMFLANQRQWFVNFDPMAFVASSYIYDKQLETLPLVVGPAMLEQFGQQVPLGMIFQNTPASGMHPYQGGSLTLVIILNRLQRQNNADKLLNVVESISGAIDPSTAFSVYLKVAKTVVDGVETLLGLQQTVPVLGYRLTINPDIGQIFEPAYCALIDAADQQIERNKFWVRESRLYYGDQLATAQPYRGNDFVLFSIAQGKERNDERTLPFYPLWETTQDFASRPGENFWQEAKAQFNTLKRELLESPDLTQPDSKRLRDTYFEELKKRRQDTIMEGQLVPTQLSDTEAELQHMATELNKLD